MWRFLRGAGVHSRAAQGEQALPTDGSLGWMGGVGGGIGTAEKAWPLRTRPTDVQSDSRVPKTQAPFSRASSSKDSLIGFIFFLSRVPVSIWRPNPSQQLHDFYVPREV